MGKKIVTIIPDSTDLRPDPRVADRYQVHPRTIIRWEQDKDLGFPPALRINNRKYRSVKQLEDWERRRAASAERPSKKEDDSVLSTVIADCLREAGATTDEIDVLLKGLPERFRQQSDVGETAA